MPNFEGKVVLVTGGTRGIGRACVHHFAMQGATVALCGRSDETAQAAAAEIDSECPGPVHGFEADISNSESVDNLVKNVTESLGPISILVNNAGITKDGLILRMKNEDWSTVLETNLSGVFYCCRAVAKGMLRQRYGRIINISSIVGLRGQAGQANYAAAKAGIVGFSKALAQELATRNITVNVVAPGYVKTDMTAAFSEDTHAKIVEGIPIRREGKAEEVAHAVAFLADEDSAYITGHVLNVDGGLAM